LDGIVEAVDAVQDRHGPKELRARQVGMRRDVFDDRRCKPPTGTVEALAAGEHALAFERLQYPFEARLSHQRPRVVTACALDEAVAKLVVDGGEHDQAARGGAALA